MLARALDRDEFLAGLAFAGATRRHRAGDLVAVEPPVGGRPIVIARAAISGGGGRAAGRAGGEAAVDAVAVGVVGDNESALLGRRRDRDVDIERSTKGERGKHVAHRFYSLWRGCTVGRERSENAREALTVGQPRGAARERAGVGPGRPARSAPGEMRSPFEKRARNGP